MKLRASETVFALICLCAAIVAVAAVIVVRTRSVENELTVSFAEPSKKADDYDVSVINRATLDDFTQVSGIGQVKASDIIAYRDAIGGFSRVSQLKDVNGISDALYQRIIEYFYSGKRIPEVTTAEATADREMSTTVSTEITVSQTESSQSRHESKNMNTESENSATTDVPERNIRSVNINSADVSEISDALMIDRDLAEEIVALRERIGFFSAVQELYLCDSMTNDIYGRIKEYVLIE